jgi:hypothetical protein
VKDPDRPASPAHVISRRGFLGAIAAVAGTATVVKPDRPDPPDPRLLRPKVRWIGHL